MSHLNIFLISMGLISIIISNERNCVHSYFKIFGFIVLKPVRSMLIFKYYVCIFGNFLR